MWRRACLPNLGLLRLVQQGSVTSGERANTIRWEDRRLPQTLLLLQPPSPFSSCSNGLHPSSNARIHRYAGRHDLARRGVLLRSLFQVRLLPQGKRQIWE